MDPFVNDFGDGPDDGEALVQRILKRGIHEPLSEREQRALMERVITVQRHNAALRGDVETCLALRQGGPIEDLLH